MEGTLQSTICILCCFVVFVSTVTSESRTPDDKKLTNVSNEGVDEKVVGINKTSSECDLSLAEPKVVEVINGYFASGTKLLRYKLLIDGYTGAVINSTNGSLYQPTSWILINSPAGASLLLLKDYFNEMSLYTLGFGTETIEVNVNQTPFSCLVDLDESSFQIEERLSSNILRSFGDNELRLSSGIRACNRHVKNTSPANVATFEYRCCEERFDGTVHCEDVKETIWLTLLFNTIHFLQLLVILFSPMLVPQTAVRVSTTFIDYVYNAGDKPLKLNVLKLSSDQKMPPDDGFIAASTHEFTNMEKFKECVDEKMAEGKTYSVSVEQVKLKVKASKIIPEGYVPVGFFTFLKKFLFRCGLRKDIPAVTPCCDADMFKRCPCQKRVPWYRCGIYLASAFLPFLLLSPWILRVWFYYSVEESEVTVKRNAMISRHLILSSTGSLTTDLSPTSTLFMVTYIVVPVQIILYTLVPRKVKRKLKFTIKQCFREMRNTKASDVCAKFTEYLCLPFIYYGVLGCVFLPFVLGIFFPILFVIFTARTLPIIDVSFRMITNCLYYILKIFYPESLSVFTPEDDYSCLAKLYKHIRNIFGNVIVTEQEKCHKRKNKLIYAVSLACCFVTMWLLLLIVAECILFYVECAVYTLTGIILNSGKVMKQVTLILIILYYGFDCFGSVYSVYVSFNKVINKKIQNAVGDDIKAVAVMKSDEQPNTAFAVGTLSEKLRLTLGSYGFIKCSISNLLLFLTSDDVPLIPRKFLMHIAQKSHFACPKKPHVLYLRALLDFLSILLFLMFVFIVIFAFGQANNVSSANQSLAALGGGFLPLVFRKFLFKSHDGPSLDSNNIAWTMIFDEAVQECTCLWDVADIVVKSCEETDMRNKELDEFADLNGDDQVGIRLLQSMEPSPEDVDLKVKILANGSLKLFVNVNQDEHLYDISRIQQIGDTRV